MFIHLSPRKHQGRGERNNVSTELGDKKNSCERLSSGYDRQWKCDFTTGGAASNGLQWACPRAGLWICICMRESEKGLQLQPHPDEIPLLMASRGWTDIFFPFHLIRRINLNPSFPYIKPVGTQDCRPDCESGLLPTCSPHQNHAIRHAGTTWLKLQHPPAQRSPHLWSDRCIPASCIMRRGL